MQGVEDLGIIAGRRVLITGAGRGLGAVLARAFDAAGADVGLVARSESALREVAADLKGDPFIAAGDVRDAEFNESVAAGMVDRFGGLDVWVANAGVSSPDVAVEDVAPRDWSKILDVNLTGTFLAARAASRVMVEGGRFIVTSSVIGTRPRAGLAAYAASKSGVNALVQALALEFGPRGITANAVALGWFDTGLGAHWHGAQDRNDDIVQHTALGRWGTPDDLPGIYLFLASDASAYVTGVTITVDGGYALL